MVKLIAETCKKDGHALQLLPRKVSGLRVSTTSQFRIVLSLLELKEIGKRGKWPPGKVAKEGWKGATGPVSRAVRKEGEVAAPPSSEEQLC